MGAPSPEMLEVFAAAAKTMSVNRLLDLRLLFERDDEHPSTIKAVDEELLRRANRCPAALGS